MIISVSFLWSCNISRESNSHTRVLVVVPPQFEGKTVINFDQDGFPSLKKGRLGYVTFLNSNDCMINTSTSFNRFDSVKFYFIRFNKDSTLYFDSTSTINYHYYFCQKKNSNQYGDFKNKKFYVGYFYKEHNNSSQDSLIQFLRTINADILDIH